MKLFNKEPELIQKYKPITYNWIEYDIAVKELSKIKEQKDRLAQTKKYLLSHDLADEHYQAMFETAKRLPILFLIT